MGHLRAARHFLLRCLFVNSWSATYYLETFGLRSCQKTPREVATPAALPSVRETAAAGSAIARGGLIDMDKSKDGEAK